MSSRNVPPSVTPDKSVSSNGHVPGAGADPSSAGDLASAAPDGRPPWEGEADFERLKVQSLTTAAPKSSTALKVIVRKPKAQEYIRVRPGGDWQGRYGLVRDQRTDTLYVVRPELHGELADEFAYYLVVTAINTQGDVFLWPLPMADSSGRTNTWWESAFEGAQRAEGAWVRLKPDPERGRYDLRESIYALPEPQWPEQTFGDLFRLAFKDVVIASLEHPFIRRLRGAL